ncbi:zinc finger HIT domain-containing protein 2 [Galleria mellonella]|uniref:Zinc finger HIT domain-containing protein 2 n=1 Tax=Galleria mellonella TaxID=7137 RepID=A0A6J1WJY6_GALME|nr:zinc finger HIT domain-containing protein 2 [Galleria mellonella]
MSNTNYSLSEVEKVSKEKPPNNKERICGLCDTNISKYCCPRCEIFYCSLDCYKSEQHNACSESFYRDCVNEELAFHQADDDSKRKMLDILKKMQEQDEQDLDIPEELLEDDHSVVDSDDEEEIDLHERIKDLNLDDPDAVWNVLTEDERNEFEALLNQGEVGSIIPQWEPWWMYRKEEKVVEDVSYNIELEEKLKDCPPLKMVPPLSSLTTVQPSPAIKFNITNIIASYVFLMRYFNGEMDVVEGTISFLNICANLDTNMNFEDLATAVESVAQKSLQSDLIETDKNSSEVMKHDTFLILQGPSKEKKLHYCKAVLSHVHNIFTKAKTIDKISNEGSKTKSEFSRKFPEHKRDHLPNLDISKVKKCIKKLEYYLSYIESFDMEF